ncbi:hypothetical protein PHET_07782 [Paragonimus heterotremus]|uniref:rhomboid protease n=1 Tax=Paragonimus heterotremus TaxID=100268 RepID=A0A8J4SMP6_9TREM|nr:hypothetical protein PHET_07782 [Paragonimus heterotremus]
MRIAVVIPSDARWCLVLIHRTTERPRVIFLDFKFFCGPFKTTTEIVAYRRFHVTCHFCTLPRSAVAALSSTFSSLSVETLRPKSRETPSLLDTSSTQQDRNVPRSPARDFLRKVRTKFELLLGRPFNATDVYWVIVAFNLLVFFGNRSSLNSVFLRYFANSPYSPTPALSMFLSVFSHHSLLHLGINMYVLHSFTPTLIGIIGSGEFLSVFLGGGIFASFMSLLNKAIYRSPIPSLGASGAICAVLGAFCLLQPHARLCVPFVVDILPHSFKAENAAWTLLFLELFAAFIFHRSPIDHAAHFGGLLFGIYYGLSGTDGILKRRTEIASWWRNCRRG